MIVDKTAPTPHTDSASDHPVLKESSPKPYYPHLRERRINHYPTVGSSGAEAPVLARLCLDSNLASNEPTVSFLRPSDHPVLLSSLLLCNSSGHLETGPSDHLTVSSSFFLLCSVPSAPTLAPMVPSVHSTVPFFFFSFVSSTSIFAST
jgi:hypothetical protein